MTENAKSEKPQPVAPTEVSTSVVAMIDRTVKGSSIRATEFVLSESVANALKLGAEAMRAATSSAK